jgi:hypothetical protein
MISFHNFIKSGKSPLAMLTDVETNFFLVFRNAQTHGPAQ